MAFFSFFFLLSVEFWAFLSENGMKWNAPAQTKTQRKINQCRCCMCDKWRAINNSNGLLNKFSDVRFECRDFKLHYASVEKNVCCHFFSLVYIRHSMCLSQVQNYVKNRNKNKLICIHAKQIQILDNYQINDNRSMFWTMVIRKTRKKKSFKRIHFSLCYPLLNAGM